MRRKWIYIFSFFLLLFILLVFRVNLRIFVFFVILTLVDKVLFSLLKFPGMIGIELATFIFFLLSKQNIFLVPIVSLIIFPFIDTLKTFYFQWMEPPNPGSVILDTLKWFAFCFFLIYLSNFLPFRISALIMIALKNLLESYLDYQKGQFNPLQKIGNFLFNFILFVFLEKTPLWFLIKWSGISFN